MTVKIGSVRHLLVPQLDDVTSISATLGDLMPTNDCQGWECPPSVWTSWWVLQAAGSEEAGKTAAPAQSKKGKKGQLGMKEGTAAGFLDPFAAPTPASAAPAPAPPKAAEPEAAAPAATPSEPKVRQMLTSYVAQQREENRESEVAGGGGVALCGS